MLTRLIFSNNPHYRTIKSYINSNLPFERTIIEDCYKLANYNYNPNKRYSLDLKSSQEKVLNLIKRKTLPKTVLVALTALLLNTGCNVDVLSSYVPETIISQAQGETSQKETSQSGASQYDPAAKHYSSTMYIQPGEVLDIQSKGDNRNISWRISDQSVATIKTYGKYVRIVGTKTLNATQATVYSVDDDTGRTVDKFTLINGKEGSAKDSTFNRGDSKVLETKDSKVKNLTWKSSDTNIVALKGYNKQVNLIAVNPGMATINSYNDEDGSIVDTFKIKVD